MSKEEEGKTVISKEKKELKEIPSRTLKECIELSQKLKTEMDMIKNQLRELHQSLISLNMPGFRYRILMGLDLNMEINGTHYRACWSGHVKDIMETLKKAHSSRMGYGVPYDENKQEYVVWNEIYQHLLYSEAKPNVKQFAESLESAFL